MVLSVVGVFYDIKCNKAEQIIGYVAIFKISIHCGKIDT